MIGSSADTPILVVHVGESRTVVRLDRDVTSLGSDPECHVFVPDESLVARHAIIQKTETGYEVFDLSGKTGGVMHNGVGVEAAALASGDELTLGGVRAMYVDPNAEVLPAGMQLLFGDLPPQATRQGAILAHHDHRNGESFHDAFLDALKRTPWLLMSCVFHLLIYFCVVTFFEEEPLDLDTPPEVGVQFEDEFATEDVDEQDEEEDIEEEEEPAEEYQEEPLEQMEQVDPAEIGTGDDEHFDEHVAGTGFGGLDTSGEVRQVGGSLGNVSGGLEKGVKQLRASGLDICFLIDATGSMDAEIAACKRRVSDMIALLESFDIQFRIGVVAFRDKNDDYVTSVAPLTPLRYKAVDFIDTIEAAGGDDTPEAVFEAVLAGTRLKWSPKAKKVMVLVGDAPPHERTMNPLYSLVGRFVKKQGVLHTILTDSNSGFDFYGTKKIFRKLAVEGHGRALELEEEDALVEDILCLALNAYDRNEIRRVIANVSSGWKGRLMRERLEKNDLPFVIEQLSAKRMRALVPLELMRANGPKLLPAYLDVLRNRKVPVANRWLTTVLMRRLLRRIDSYQDIGHKARVAMDRFRPEGPWGRQQRDLKDITRSLYDTGVLE